MEKRIKLKKMRDPCGGPTRIPFRPFVSSLFWRYYFLSLLLYVFNICELIYKMKVVKGGTPLVSLWMRLGFTNMTLFYGHT